MSSQLNGLSSLRIRVCVDRIVKSTMMITYFKPSHIVFYSLILFILLSAGTYLKIKAIAMSHNKPWIVVYMKGNACNAVRALMYTIDTCTDATFVNCKIGAIVDCDKAGLDMIKSLMVPSMSCPEAEKVFRASRVYWIGVRPSTIISNQNLSRGQLSVAEANGIVSNLNQDDFFPAGCNETARRHELTLIANQRIQANTAYITRAYWDAKIDTMLTNAI